MYRFSYKFSNNVGTSKWTEIYHKSNVFNVVYQEIIRIVFLFNSKLYDCVESNKRPEELANKTDNRTFSYKHRTGRTLVQL